MADKTLEALKKAFETLKKQLIAPENPDAPYNTQVRAELEKLRKQTWHLANNAKKCGWPAAAVKARQELHLNIGDWYDPFIKEYDIDLYTKRQEFKALQERLTATAENPDAPYNAKTRAELEKLRRQAHYAVERAKKLGWPAAAVQTRQDLLRYIGTWSDQFKKEHDIDLYTKKQEFEALKTKIAGDHYDLGTRALIMRLRKNIRGSMHYLQDLLSSGKDPLTQQQLVNKKQLLQNITSYQQSLDQTHDPDLQQIQQSFNQLAQGLEEQAYSIAARETLDKVQKEANKLVKKAEKEGWSSKSLQRRKDLFQTVVDYIYDLNQHYPLADYEKEATPVDYNVRDKALERKRIQFEGLKEELIQAPYNQALRAQVRKVRQQVNTLAHNAKNNGWTEGEVKARQELHLNIGDWYDPFEKEYDIDLYTKRQEFEALKKQLTATVENPDAPYNSKTRVELEKLRRQTNSAANKAQKQGWPAAAVKARQELQQGIADWYDDFKKKYDIDLYTKRQEFSALKERLTATPENPDAPYDTQARAELEKLRGQAASTAYDAKKRGLTEISVQARQDLHQEIRTWYDNFKAQYGRTSRGNRGTTLNSGLAFAETALPTKWQQKIDAIPGFFYDDRGPSVISRVYTAVKPKVKGAVKAMAHELTPPTNPKVYATGPLSYMVNNGQTDMALMILVSAAMPDTMREHGRTIEDGLPFVTAPIEHYIIGTTGGAGFFATTSQIVRYYVLPKVISWSHTVGKVTEKTVKATGTALKPTAMAMATVPLAETAAITGGVAVMGLTMYAVANIPIEEAINPDQIRTLLKAGHITYDQAFNALGGDNKPYVIFLVDPPRLDDVLNKMFPDSHLAFHITDGGGITRLKTTLPMSAPKTWSTVEGVELNFTPPATLEKLKEAIVPQNLTAPASKKQKETVVPQNQLALGVGER